MRTILSGNPIGKGPNGTAPQPAESVELTPADVEAIRAGEYTAAIVFHYLKTDYVRLQRMGLEERFGELGIEIEGIYNPEFDTSKQAEILESLAERDIDALVSIPIDQVATADAYRTVAESGTDIVFIDNVPQGFEHPRDYAGTVSSDNRGLGIFAGRILRDTLSSGQVGIVKFNAPFYVTSEREQGARDILEAANSIELIAETGFTDPDDVYQRTQELLVANPDIEGLFVSWGDPPGTQAAAAALDLGMDDIAITTTGLSIETATNIARNGPIKATGAQFPYQQGHIEANMIGNSLLANSTPPFIASGVLPIHHGNLLDLYPTYFQEEAPEEIRSHYE
ncbi:sugar ABC transporter substrate-binding protein [Haloferax sp. Atlit-10N]|nr:substrate-binding domain-containing protein [Haloferax sp. Atlit-16N]RDZ44520.1 sugar ABC transporter substrate-binding protein [Haloferax sp. Atlit-16N]RDZ56329.1 sugar ABC transporter substrate-binding protein [Haloferax sp. Atlit-10N]